MKLVNRMGILTLGLALALAGAACGDDDDTSATTGDGDGTTGDGDGMTGDGDGTTGDGDGMTGDGDGMTGDGDGMTGGGNTVNLGDLLGGDGGVGFGFGGGAECDDAITDTASCGGMDCPEITSPLAGATCSVRCCTAENTCGTRRALADGATDCQEPAEEDANCLPYESGMGDPLVGCCAPSGRCGVISTIDASCITSSTLLADLAPGDVCDGSATGGGDEDAGI